MSAKQIEETLHRRVTGAGLVVAAALSLAGCGASAPPTEEPTEPAAAEPEVAPGTVSARTTSSCAIHDGEVYCWGDNRPGFLRSDEPDVTSSPARVDGLEGARRVAMGGYHACALRLDDVCCWGANGAHQLAPRGIEPHELVCNSAPGARDLAVGDDHTCVLGDDGRARCWGVASYGQLGTEPPGRGVGTGSRALPFDPLRHAGPPGVIDVAAGPGRSCFVTDDGGVWCAGMGVDPSTRCSFTESSVSCSREGEAQFWKPRRLGILPAMRRVETSREWLCGIERSGVLRCARVVGDGSFELGPPVDGLADVVDLAVSDREVCAVHDGGRVSCFAPSTETVTPSRVGVPEAVAITLGARHACAALRDGGARCWGDDAYGQLGRGGRLDAPMAIDLGGPVERVFGRGRDVCGVNAQGEVRCAGPRGGASEGAALSTTSLPWPPASIDHDGATGCAVGAQGEPVCWGEGVGSDAPASMGTTDVAEIVVGLTGGCARRRNGSVDCWDGSDAAHARAVDGVEGATAIRGDDRWACALVDGGRVACWSGEVMPPMRGIPRDPLAAVTVEGIEGADRVDVGCDQVCARLTDGEVLCAPLDRHPIPRRGRPAPSARPVGIDDAVEISVGCGRACALLEDGSLRCWSEPSASPAAAPVERAESVHVGGAWACGISDGRPTCWGVLPRHDPEPAPVALP